MNLGVKLASEERRLRAGRQRAAVRIRIPLRAAGRGIRAPARERGQNVVSEGADARGGMMRSRAKYPN